MSLLAKFGKKSRIDEPHNAIAAARVTPAAA